MSDRYIQLCAAINHAQTHSLPLPREWLLLKKELKHEWCQAHGIIMPAVDAAVNLNGPDISTAEREFSAVAYTDMMSQSSEITDAKQVPWWDFFLKVQ